ncbi:sugar ABC transporter permease [uncultured Clostridium sp.]|uniref:carbohydrate ABC transporter permease n=1 Tax=uncultured Clostridium sp. TaxID=59620 RepID=UPI00261BDFAB|nr:sugar ABC transporter permease [uncultured Clostridium sp.]
MNSRSFKERKVLITFLSLPIILLLLFGIIPMVKLIYYSFTDWNGMGSGENIVYLDNYIKILTNPKYLEVFKNCIYYLISGLLQIIIGFMLAYSLSEKLRGKSFFKGIFILPILISGVTISMMFRVVFSPDGTLNGILTMLGLEEYIRYWLGDPKIVNWSLASISLWRYTGLSFILYLGAIAAIPKEYFKVVSIEGGRALEKIKYVILPNIKTTIKINLLMLLIGVVSVFDIPMIMTEGSNGTSTVILKTMDIAFKDKDFGLASAMAVIVSLIIILISLVRYLIKKRVKNEESLY